MHSQNIIVIPVYQSAMSCDEMQSLKQCLTILAQYDIALVCPKSMDTSQYDAVFTQYGVHPIITRFDDEYFTSLNSYSQLCLSADFYKRFEKYNYMLIYQLDCWVFYDTLQYWCDMGYDYVGAPWAPKLLAQWGLEKHPVGNGGLSLRKIDTMIKLTSYPIRNQKVPIRCSFRCFFNSNKKRRLISNILSMPIIVIKYMGIKKYYSVNEDIIIAVYAKKYIHGFSIPDALTAAQFSVESDPQYFCNKIGELPFGTHAWNKDENRKFWTQFINI